ncbi:MAG: type II toxin-antitoxin system RelB/DinJ family antitoxin [Lachnospiraceae bacterium]|nr:type II toxin-antitoxin system RelB/DinJ family antitoxin [Lachnospiraceae bacterium]
MITVSLRFEEDMKKELDEMCEEMGMNLTTFFMIYAKKALRDRRIPFDIVAPAREKTDKKVFEREMDDSAIDKLLEEFVMPSERGNRVEEYMEEMRGNDRI